MSKIRDKLFVMLDPKHADGLKAIPDMGAPDLIFVPEPLYIPAGMIDDVSHHTVGHISFSVKDEDGKFWDAVVGAETETVDNGDGTFTHSTPPAKPALSAAQRKRHEDLAQALLDMDCARDDDLVC